MEELLSDITEYYSYINALDFDPKEKAELISKLDQIFGNLAMLNIKDLTELNKQFNELNQESVDSDEVIKRH